MEAKLVKQWTDGNGISHEAGELVDVDAATLAELEADGFVELWIGPTTNEKSVGSTTAP